MTDTGAYADVVPHGNTTWLTVLRKRLHPDSPVYLPTLGPVTKRDRGFEVPAEWLREQGYDVASWRAGPNGGFRAKLRKL